MSRTLPSGSRSQNIGGIGPPNRLISASTSTSASFSCACTASMSSVCKLMPVCRLPVWPSGRAARSRSPRRRAGHRNLLPSFCRHTDAAAGRNSSHAQVTETVVRSSALVRQRSRCGANLEPPPPGAGRAICCAMRRARRSGRGPRPPPPVSRANARTADKSELPDDCPSRQTVPRPRRHRSTSTGRSRRLAPPSPPPPHRDCAP